MKSDIVFQAEVVEALGRLLQRPVSANSQLWADLRINSDILPEVSDLIANVSGIDLSGFNWMKYVPAGWAVGPGEVMWTRMFGAKVSPLSVAELCELVRSHDAAHRSE